MTSSDPKKVTRSHGLIKYKEEVRRKNINTQKCDFGTREEPDFF